ncbi:nitrate reductase alpha subunit [Candidatus Thiomargarita nelsonii]|uniref:Nitrate reductase alpha subunit n=1 Tax=Candidatus Thiomargarita nelsonii TaxID=1003181 RepID=A0A176S1P6_9GAMM|nr:nitrate reductase alpha subunit [Candidatus Thiomargarita nelsonii]
MFDETTGAPKMPKGTVGHRWQSKQGQWNLELKDGLDDSPIAPLLSFIENSDEILQVEFEDFSNDNAMNKRGVPVKYIETAEGKVAVTTTFDLMMGHFGVNRDLGGEYANSYDESEQTYTPAWQEKFTGISKKIVINFARQFADTAEKTDGKCTVIIGAGINHWYHNNLIYRGPITALMLCGCVGKNGGGLAHYVGQEKLAPIAPWKAVSSAADWGASARMQNAPSWHYIHSDQWRYEGPFSKYSALKGDNEWTEGHACQHH